MNLLKIDYSKRVYGLDVFRAVAILLVVKGHGGMINGDLFDFMPSIFRIDGVELFFVLSGFLIGSILIKSVEKEGGFSASSLVHFWKRRWYRTLPNYYLILLLNYLFVRYEVINGDIEAFSYKFLFFIHNFSSGFQGFFWESWSLSVEEWFYITLPLLVLVLSRFLYIKKTFLISIIILIAVPMLYRYSISDTPVDKYWLDVNFRKVVLTRLDAVNFGVLAAYLKFYHTQLFYKNKNVMFALGVFLLYANSFMPKEPYGIYAKVISFTVMSVGASLLLPKADSVKSFKYATIGKAITFISVISYAMYLINLAMVAQVIDKNFPPQNLWQNAYLYVFYWIATIGLSTLLYTFYEKPMTNLRDR